MGERVCHRYKTRALVGPWRRQREHALQDAINAGQLDPAAAETPWLVTGGIETSYCDEGGPCGGEYPPPDEPRRRRA